MTSNPAAALAATDPQDLASMRSRLYAALVSLDSKPYAILTDLIETLTKAGATYQQADLVMQEMLRLMRFYDNITVVESNLNSLLKRMMVTGDKCLLDHIKEMLSGRADLVFSQIRPFLTSGQKVVDIGCGDGQVTQRIFNEFGGEVVGFDVRNYRAQGVTVPLHVCPPEELPVVDGYFDVAVMTNVLHHANNNQNLLLELVRVLKPGGLAIIIETVPLDDSAAEFQRTLAGDWFYNRVFHYGADIPVPGTYETAAGWIERFAKVGLIIAPVTGGRENPQNLGYDQPLIKDFHVLYVLEKDETYDIGAL